MSGTRTLYRNRLLVVMSIALWGGGLHYADAVAAEAYPAAPTINDAHRYFDSLVSSNGVTALYETVSKNGALLGYESFPVQRYNWAVCRSGVILKNNVQIAIDWTVVEKSQSSDGTLSILQNHNVQFKFFHMVSVEGGIVVEPSRPLPNLVLGISDEVSRNRLSKAIDLLSTACRKTSKFD